MENWEEYLPYEAKWDAEESGYYSLDQDGYSEGYYDAYLEGLAEQEDS